MREKLILGEFLKRFRRRKIIVVLKWHTNKAMKKWFLMKSGGGVIFAVVFIVSQALSPIRPFCIQQGRQLTVICHTGKAAMELPAAEMGKAFKSSN